MDLFSLSEGLVDLKDDFVNIDSLLVEEGLLDATHEIPKLQNNNIK